MVGARGRGKGRGMGRTWLPQLIWAKATVRWYCPLFLSWSVFVMLKWEKYALYWKGQYVVCYKHSQKTTSFHILHTRWTLKLHGMRFSIKIPASDANVETITWHSLSQVDNKSEARTWWNYVSRKKMSLYQNLSLPDLIVSCLCLAISSRSLMRPICLCFIWLSV